MRTRQWISVLALTGLSAVACAQPSAPVKVSKGSGSQVVLQFHKVRPASVEIVVDGIVIATRTVSGNQVSLGLLNAGLAPGVHEAIIRLYDRQGRLIGEAHTAIELQIDPYAPVSVIIPRNGTRVSGLVPIETRVNTGNNAYVTFFVDGQVRALRNFAPYVYQWDTTLETNGWHTIEVWSFDGKQTFKSPPTRVFVNNPGGRTERKAEPEPAEAPEPSLSAVELPIAEVQGTLRTYENWIGQSVDMERLSVPSAEAVVPPTTEEPLMHLALASPERNPAHWRDPESIGNFTADTRLTQPDVPPSTLFVRATTSGYNPAWRVVQAEPHMRGQKLQTPRFIASAPPANSPTPYENAVMLFHRGMRLPDTVRSFELVLNHKVVASEVVGRVESGIPLVTVRHIMEMIGAEIRWDNARKQATITLGEKRLVLDVRANQALLNDTSLPLDAPLRIIKGRVVIPASLLGDVLNAEMLFDLESQRLIITSS